MVRFSSKKSHPNKKDLRFERKSLLVEHLEKVHPSLLRRCIVGAIYSGRIGQIIRLINYEGPSCELIATLPASITAFTVSLTVSASSWGAGE